MNKRHSKRLQGLLPKPAKVFSWKFKDIKDIEKLELIWICDKWHEYGTMCILIKEYGEFEFFRDLLIYLRSISYGLSKECADINIDSYYEHFQTYYYEKFCPISHLIDKGIRII